MKGKISVVSRIFRFYFRQCPFELVYIASANSSALSRSCSRKQIHVQISFRTPLGPGHVTETGRAEHQRRMAVREGPHDSGSSPDLPHDPLQGIVRPDPDPMLTGKVIVGKGFEDRLPDLPGRLLELHPLQFDTDRLPPSRSPPADLPRHGSP